MHLARNLYCLVILALPLLAKADANASNAAFFESKIRPLLADRCYECHSASTKQKGGLLLDSKAGWQHGGDSGPALLPGKPEQSLLIKAVQWTDPDLQMPPKKSGGKLTDRQIADLVEWVARGAFDPRTNGTALVSRKSWEDLFTERRRWWSLLPVRPSSPPKVKDAEWTRSAIDQFLRTRMLQEDINPAPLADPATLVRRASLVLTGLPPTPEEAKHFCAEAAASPETAWRKLIDRLLSSPHFGERFARHWLDVVRFTETHGNEWNYDLPFAWRYRDYVIRAFNEDVPYDQFVREHIAGDLLPGPRWNKAGHFNESVIGTAFFRFGEVNHDSCVQFGVIGYDIVDNQLDTLTKAFQATTVACARCHDHKMDAVSTRDYHALLGVLRSTRSVMRTLDGPETNRDALAALRKQKKAYRAELARIWRSDAVNIDAAKLRALAAAAKDKTPDISSPLHAWYQVSKPACTNLPAEWTKLSAAHSNKLADHSAFNRTNFTLLADFRNRIPSGWVTDGMGLRDGVNRGSDFVPAHDGSNAVKAVLSSGLFTFALSDRLNGALRSPTLPRTRAKISFEVVGGRFSLARMVFNNCQLNYTHQHSIHHDAWSWVTVNFSEKTDELHPYAELLTFWDNPKFPDPLGTLGKDTENQREPFDTHAKNPRTWWGVRRIVLHDGDATPKPELTHLSRLYDGATPKSLDDFAARYSVIANAIVKNFASERATDDDMLWLDWLLKQGLLSNKTNASPRLATLAAQYREIENRLALPQTMPGMADEASAFMQPVLARGDYAKPGAPVSPGYVQALTPEGFKADSTGSGRRELAQLIASSQNPLTARVLVNRVWHWVFGRGLVATPDDFGHLGEQPSHPELLDYLTDRFIKEGWSVKKLVRELMLTRSFRSASAPHASAQQHDPDNILLSHFSARRVEAEIIRDSLLAVSGRLDAKMFGPSVHPFRAKPDNEKRLFTGPLDGNGRRSIYIKCQLMEAPPFLRVFNLPDGKVAQGRREASNTPAQSLALLNDPFVLAMAEHWATRLIQDDSKTLGQRVNTMFQAALGRQPTEPEENRFCAALMELARLNDVPEPDILSSRAVWKDAAHAIFNLKEFIFIP